MPTLVASYSVAQGRNSTTLTSPAFTPSVGEVIVVKLAVENANVISGAPTATGLTFTKRAEVGLGQGGSQTYVAIYTAVVATSQSYTISSTFATGTSSHSMLVERWSNATLAATPVTGTAVQSTAPSLTLNGLTSGSAISWVSVDWNAVAGTSRTYRNAAQTTEEVAPIGTANTDYTVYNAYTTASLSTLAVGLTAPTGQSANMAGIEILDTGPATGPQTLTRTVQTAAANTGTWTNPANAQGASDTASATWVNATRSATASLDLTFDLSPLASAPAGTTIDSITFTVRHSESSTSVLNTPTISWVNSAGTVVVTSPGFTRATALRTDTWSPVSLTNINDLIDGKLRFNASRTNSTTSTTQSVEYAQMVVNYTIPAAATNYDGQASLAGSGSLVATGTAAAAATNYDGTSSLAGSGSSSASGLVGKVAAATLAATAALTASGVVARSSSSTVAGTGALSSSGQVGARSTGLVAGTGSLSAAGQVGISGGASALQGIGTIGAAGSAVTGYTGTASVAGSGTLSSSGTMARGSGATVAGAGALAATGAVGRSGGATSQGTGSVTATGTVGVRGSAALTAVSFLTPSGTTATSASSSLAGLGSLTSSGSSVSGVLGSAARAGVGTLSVAYVVGRTSPTSIAGAGALTSSGSVGRSTPASTTGVGALSSTGRVGSSSSAALAGSGDLQADGLVAVRGSAALAGSGSLLVVGVKEEAGFARVEVHGTGSLEAAGQVRVVDVVVTVGETGRRHEATGGRRWSTKTEGRVITVELGIHNTVELGDR